jgi:hypothetical protein
MHTVLDSAAFSQSLLAELSNAPSRRRVFSCKSRFPIEPIGVIQPLDLGYTVARAAWLARSGVYVFDGM